MERVEFNYVLRDGEEEERIINFTKRNQDGLHDYDLCEMFIDFMRSCGFSEENVLKYFR